MADFDCFYCFTSLFWTRDFNCSFLLTRGSHNVYIPLLLCPFKARSEFSQPFPGKKSETIRCEPKSSQFHQEG